MKKLALGALFVGLLAACGGNDPKNNKISVPDGSNDDGGGNPTCSPLTQAGCGANEKCSWIIDATMPQYVGHTGCVADGTKNVGDACTFGEAGATGYDDCKAGSVCSQFSTPGNQGVCKQICDNNGGDPMCDANHVCVTYARLFSAGSTEPAEAGVCDLACDPLEDNDFDGSAGPASKSMNTCGSDARIGCYGVPSGGAPPATGWSCTGDINSDPDKGLRHRVHCDATTGCADDDGTIYINSCNQGYLPLFRESTAVSTTVCIAMCAPLDCYAGNCGTNDVNRAGASPHRCISGNGSDAVGTFDTRKGHEECQYLWYNEVDGSGNVLVSPTSDSVGFCLDHGLYKYDSNSSGAIDNNDQFLPGCEALQIVGSGSDPSDANSYWGAVDLGCVSTTTAGLGSAHGRAHVNMKDVLVERPRFLYHRVMGAN
jgi:hypothetical protein